MELEEHGTSSSESLDTFKSRLFAASSRYNLVRTRRRNDTCRLSYHVIEFFLNA